MGSRKEVKEKVRVGRSKKRTDDWRKKGTKCVLCLRIPYRLCFFLFPSFLPSFLLVCVLSLAAVKPAHSSLVSICLLLCVCVCVCVCVWVCGRGEEGKEDGKAKLEVKRKVDIRERSEVEDPWGVFCVCCSSTQKSLETI